MSKVIAVAGKGGTGKTTIAGLLIRQLVNSKRGPILAVDADADSNLPEVLGLSSATSLATIGATREDFFTNRDNIPAGMPKQAWMEMQLAMALVESKDIDLMVMGRPEGAGCYCYINNMLRKYLETLGENYPYVVIDNEAGLEHISRRTAQKISRLVIVSDYSLNGLRAARRVRDLAREMKLAIGRVVLLINKAPETFSEHFNTALANADLVPDGCIPLDPLVAKFDIEGKSCTALPDDSTAVRAMQQITKSIVAN
jgi:CO dehydrogenase maturation factor